MTPHAIDREDIMAWIDQELDPAHAALVRAHVETCAECRAYADDLRLTATAMAEWRVDEAPASLGVPVAAAADAEAARRRRWWAGGGLPTWALTAASLAGVVIVGVVGWTVWRAPAPASPVSTAARSEASPTPVEPTTPAATRDRDPMADAAANDARPTDAARQALERDVALSSRGADAPQPGAGTSGGRLAEEQARPTFRQQSAAPTAPAQGSTAPVRGGAAAATPPEASKAVAAPPAAPQRAAEARAERPATGAVVTAGAPVLQPGGRGGAGRGGFAASAEGVSADAAQERAVRGPLVAQSVTLELAVPQLDAARVAVREIVGARRGRVDQEAEQVRGAGRGGSDVKMTLRVPVAELDAALDALRALGTARGDSRTSEPLDDEWRALTTRQAAARAQETRLVTLRDQSRAVADTVAVEAELAKVRAELAELDAAERALRARHDLATVLVVLSRSGSIRPR